MESIGLTNKYVKSLCFKLIPKQFIDTIPCNWLMHYIDLMKTRIMNGDSFGIIVNLSPDTHSGSHYIALSYNNGKLSFFDSLLLQYEDPNITAVVEYLLKNVPFIQFCMSKKRIQDISSVMCGFHCISFLLSQHKTNPVVLEEYEDYFYDNDLLRNDEISKKFIVEYINDYTR